MEEFSDSTRRAYVDSLIGRVFKILPIYENNTTFEGGDFSIYLKYLEETLGDIVSANNLLFSDDCLVNVMVKLNKLRVEDGSKLSHVDVRKTILDTVGEIVKIRDYYDKKKEG